MWSILTSIWTFDAMSLIMQDTAEYQISVSREIEARLKAKCDKLADAFIDDIGSLMYPIPYDFFSVLFMWLIVSMICGKAYGQTSCYVIPNDLYMWLKLKLPFHFRFSFW